ncbi:hypothetical protein C8Q74DRAFT_1248664 [Fomes fomentarius]|nr:hypothetical protein C8Q74DRAFT_1248664 [Fomes fomentarius]
MSQNIDLVRCRFIWRVSVEYLSRRFHSLRQKLMVERLVGSVHFADQLSRAMARPSSNRPSALKEFVRQALLQMFITGR